MANGFKALLVSEKDGKFEREIRTINFDDLPPDEILIKVAFSSLNYKDALSASGNKGVTRKFPHIPGIDAAGTVVKSANAEYKVGAQVIVTGFDLGMNTWGGFGQYISVPATWLVLLPPALTTREAMSFGTAGLTAGLSVGKILGAGIKPHDGPIVVSGATGGVGSMATAILSTLGYRVTAISGKKEDDFLTSVLGAEEILGREEFTDKYNRKPLSGAEFSAGIDNVGGAILSGILKSVKQNGVVTCCGNVSSTEINTSIFPFILRGITLAGIDSAQAPIEFRKTVWESLAMEWKPAKLDLMIQEIGLDELPAKLDELLAGKAKGRYLLKHNG
jgi:putative YhdH/YhfP family quinone oxidoreductase